MDCDSKSHVTDRMCTRDILTVYTQTVTLDSQVTEQVCIKAGVNVETSLKLTCRRPNNMIMQPICFFTFQKPIEVDYEGEKVNVVTNQKEIDEWTDKDISAQGIIFYNIEPAFQVALEGSGSSNEMWNRLILQYAQVAIANADFLLGKFQSYKMDPGNKAQPKGIQYI